MGENRRDSKFFGPIISKSFDLITAGSNVARTTALIAFCFRGSAGNKLSRHPGTVSQDGSDLRNGTPREILPAFFRNGQCRHSAMQVPFATWQSRD
jgi:hypothetical protein